MFDPSAPHIIILLIVVLLLFGSSRLPGAANALGRSMHIFKKSVAGLGEDEQSGSAANPGSTANQGFTSSPSFTAAPPALAATQPSPDQQTQQIQDLQRQVEELQQHAAGGNAGQPSQPL